MGSRNSTTAARISQLVALAPAVYLTPQSFTWSAFAGIHLDDMASVATARAETPFTTWEEILRTKCYTGSYVQLCESCAQDMGGSWIPGDTGFAPTCWEKFLCIPAGTSSDNVRAYANAIRQGDFQRYLSTIGRAIDFTL